MEAPAIKLRGSAVVDRLAEFSYRGVPPRVVRWGDGTASGKRRFRRNAIRHRFRRPGRITVEFVTSGSECCDSAHADCREATDQITRVRVNVRTNEPDGARGSQQPGAVRSTGSG